MECGTSRATESSSIVQEISGFKESQISLQHSEEAVTETYSEF
jgi:hypothetical protein